MDGYGDPGEKELVAKYLYETRNNWLASSKGNKYCKEMVCYDWLGAGSGGWTRQGVFVIIDSKLDEGVIEPVGFLAFDETEKTNRQ